jgi:hypothetical protein
MKIEKIKSGDIQRITEWYIEKPEWAKFIAWKQTDDTELAKGTAILSSLIGALVVGFIAWADFDGLMLAMVVVGGAIAFGILIGALMYLGSKFQLQKISSKEDGQIIFTEKNILMNSLVISFNEMGMRLKEVKSVTVDDWNFIDVLVESGFGNRKNSHNFSIPIPEGKEEEAEKIVEIYRKLVS